LAFSRYELSIGAAGICGCVPFANTSQALIFRCPERIRARVYIVNVALSRERKYLRIAVPDLVGPSAKNPLPSG